jgi:hypothetical protein
MPKDSREKPVFHFFGTADGVLGEITLSQPVQRNKHEWTAHLVMTGPFREDLDVHGATKKQAVELALGLCHLHVGNRQLLDQRGASVRVPGKPLPKSTDVDDGVRAGLGVAACLVDEGNGRVRLVLDDVTREGQTCAVHGFYTHRRFPKKALLSLALKEKDLADIGMAVLVRLIARTFPSKLQDPSRHKSRKR